MSKNVYVIAGPNGAGKTTFARKFLPYFAHCEEFVNADLVATGLSPFAPQKSALAAGRLVLEKLAELASQGKNFGFETTLSGKTYLNFLKILKKKGYLIHIFYLWLLDESLAVQRIHDRVKQGGHLVPPEDVHRRFGRGLRHFLIDYRHVINNWILFDNSGAEPVKVAFGINTKTSILNASLYERIQKQAGLL